MHSAPHSNRELPADTSMRYTAQLALVSTQRSSITCSCISVSRQPARVRRPDVIRHQVDVGFDRHGLAVRRVEVRRHAALHDEEGVEANQDVRGVRAPKPCVRSTPWISRTPREASHARSAPCRTRDRRSAATWEANARARAQRGPR
jgi:hypothetical protein